ncbi:MAG: hypothetical protein WD069_05705 [Planctomycetales bacterium]
MRSDSSATRSFAVSFRCPPWLAAGLLLMAALALSREAAAQDTSAPNASDPAAKAALLIEKPLIDEKMEEIPFQTQLGRYSTAVRRGNLKDDGDLLRKGIRWRVRRMTLPKHRNDLPERRRDILLRDLGSAASAEPNKEKALEFRKFMLQTFLDEAKLLLDNNYHVRLNATIFISQLSLAEPDRVTGQGEQAFTPIAPVLLPLLGDPTQPVPVQIWAAKGLSRVLRTGEPDDELRHRVATRIIAELTDKPQAHYWYQARLVEALGGAKLLHFGADKSFVVDALAKVMVDRDRHPLVRSEAAKQLGRVPLDGTVNMELIVFGLADLTRELVLKQIAEPQATYWPSCFFGVYLAYRPLNRQEEQQQAGLLLKVRQQNDLQKYQATVEASFDLLVLKEPRIVPTAMRQPQGVALDPALADPIGKWLGQSKPTDLRISPGLAPLIINADVAARPDPAS